MVKEGGVDNFSTGTGRTFMGELRGRVTSGGLVTKLILVKGEVQQLLLSSSHGLLLQAPEDSFALAYHTVL